MDRKELILIKGHTYTAGRALRLGQLLTSPLDPSSSLISEEDLIDPPQSELSRRERLSVGPYTIIEDLVIDNGPRAAYIAQVLELLTFRRSHSLFGLRKLYMITGIRVACKAPFNTQTFDLKSVFVCAYRATQVSKENFSYIKNFVFSEPYKNDSITLLVGEWDAAKEDLASHNIRVNNYHLEIPSWERAAGSIFEFIPGEGDFSVKIGSPSTAEKTKLAEISDKLPKGWDVRKDDRGRLYYVDHGRQITTWEPPVAGVVIPNTANAAETSSIAHQSISTSNEILSSARNILESNESVAGTSSSAVVENAPSDTLNGDEEPAIKAFSLPVVDTASLDNAFGNKELVTKASSSVAVDSPLQKSYPSMTTSSSNGATYPHKLQDASSQHVKRLSTDEQENIDEITFVGVEDLSILPQKVASDLKGSSDSARESASVGPESTQESPKTSIYESEYSQAENVFDYTTLMSIEDSSIVAKEADLWFFYWLKESNIFLDSFRRLPMNPESMVKVALIDSGISREHPLLQQYSQRGQFGEFWDFIEDKPLDSDSTGHGTHCAHLLFKTAQYCKLYVAKAFQRSVADSSTVSFIAKAIYTAVNDWNVDIISMSFSFDEFQEPIRAAIAYAATKKVLMFAAASNNSHNKRQPVGFPARMNEVICVSSSTWQGMQSNFSPDGKIGLDNFSVVGEGINGAFPPRLNNGQELKRQSGTSCATPIAAGIAALILEYCRITPYRISDDSMNRLKLSNGMRKVIFEHMTEGRTNGTYNYIRPWWLFGGDPRYGYRKGAQKFAPQAVSFKIENTLINAM